VLGILCCFGPVTSRADVVFEHSGALNPTADEDWLHGQPGPGVTVGPTAPPVSAWYVWDDSTAADSGVGYDRWLTPCQAQQIDQLGWTMRVCLRVTDLNSQPSIWVGYNTGAKRYDMWFRSDVSGNAIVTLMTSGSCDGIFGVSYTSSGSGQCHEPGFHLFELVFSPTASSAGLFVDGVERISDYAGHTIALGQWPGFAWGAGSSCFDGRAEFHLVQFEINGGTPPLGDLNCDCQVDLADLAIMVPNLGSTGAAPQDGDLDADADVDLADFAPFQVNFGLTCP